MVSKEFLERPHRAAEVVERPGRRPLAAVKKHIAGVTSLCMATCEI